MHRRQFVTASIAAIALGPAIVRARIPPMEFDPEDFAAIRYYTDDDDGVRSLAARVSRWADVDSAEGFYQYLLSAAGSNLPLGEFYQSEPVDHPIPEEDLAAPAGARGWHTIVGAAGYVTEWILLVVQRETLLWDIRVSGAEGVDLLDLAVATAADLTSREPGDDLFALLPAAGEVPEGLVVEYTMTPDGALDADGNPIPEPTPE